MRALHLRTSAPRALTFILTMAVTLGPLFADPVAAGLTGDRDLEAETIAFIDCLSGPGETPAPTGGSTVPECLDLFDYDEDGDVDLSDHSTYLDALPPGLEFGFAFGQPYERIANGEDFPLLLGFQGFTELKVTVRDTGNMNGAGFGDSPVIYFTRSGVFVDDGLPAFTAGTASGLAMPEIAEGVNQLTNYNIVIPVNPDIYLGPCGEGRLADLTMTVETFPNREVMASVTQRVRLKPTTICGNFILEEGEDCDPPNGTTCDSDCQAIPSGPPDNDDCAAPMMVTEGTTAFTNVAATTDGPEEPAQCPFFGDPQIASDVWFSYSASCNGPASFSLCGSDYDTEIAVYVGNSCPPFNLQSCNDDGCGLTTTSRVELTVIQGQQYLVRVGGFDGDQGDGILTITCGNLPTCASGVGDCFAANGTPTCSDESCCSQVCSVDTYCCDVEWDENCAAQAEGFCNGQFAACETDCGACDSAHDAPGCNDTNCCQAVCEIDPFCCLSAWDSLCVNQAAVVCNFASVCVDAAGSCFAVQPGSPGCENEECCLLVCEQDSFCCLTEWDQVCVDLAEACR